MSGVKVSVPVGRDYAKGSNPSPKLKLSSLTEAKAGVVSGGTPVGRSFPKNGQDTKAPDSANAKTEHEQKLDIHRGEASSIGKAPTSRVYTNDYTKVGRAADDKDVTTPYLGNPLRL